jgi:hypothetical protein
MAVLHVHAPTLEQRRIVEGDSANSDASAFEKNARAASTPRLRISEYESEWSTKTSTVALLCGGPSGS